MQNGFAAKRKFNLQQKEKAFCCKTKNDVKHSILNKA